MIDGVEPIEVRFDVDTQAFTAALDDLASLSDAFGRQLTGALRDAVVNGRSLEQVLQRIGLSLAGMALNMGLRPLSGLISGLLPGFLGGGGGLPFLTEGGFAAPSYLPSASAIGAAGGAAVSAAIGQNAQGVPMDGGSRAGAPTNVVFNVTTQDAASFRKSEAQVTGMLARAVSRGTRTL